MIRGSCLVSIQRNAEGKCVICNTPSERRTRGLCEKHRGRFQRALSEISPEKRPAFEADLIAKGMLLPNRKGQKLRPEDDEFAVALGEFQAKEADVVANAAAGAMLGPRPVIDPDEPVMGDPPKKPEPKPKKKAKR